MKNIEVDYKVVRDGETILDDCYAEVNITDKNVKEVAEFIRDNHFSGELLDVPSHVYDRIVRGVTDVAISDMKIELKDSLLVTDDVVLQEVLPMDLVNLLPQDVVELIDMEKVNAYYESKGYYNEEESDEDDDDKETFTIIEDDYLDAVNADADVEYATFCGGINHVVCVKDSETEEAEETESGLYYDEENNRYYFEGEEETCKENTMYLTIRQKDFDAIMEGKRTYEEREIKPTTYKKYLDCDENGNCYFDTQLIDKENPLAGDIYVWNDGVYPYFPKPIRYLNLAVGYNKERDTALVEIDGMEFTPAPTTTGIPHRFTDTGKELKNDANGELCFWTIKYYIKRVVECHRHK